MLTAILAVERGQWARNQVIVFSVHPPVCWHSLSSSTRALRRFHLNMAENPARAPDGMGKWLAVFQPVWAVFRFVRFLKDKRYARIHFCFISFDPLGWLDCFEIFLSLDPLGTHHFTYDTLAYNPCFFYPVTI